MKTAFLFSLLCCTARAFSRPVRRRQPLRDSISKMCLGPVLRAGVRRPPGIRAGRNRRRIGLASRRDFHEGRSRAHAAHGADRLHVRRYQPFPGERKHSRRVAYLAYLTRRFEGELRLVAAAY